MPYQLMVGWSLGGRGTIDFSLVLFGGQKVMEWKISARSPNMTIAVWRGAYQLMVE